ncbi:hypothetical protein FRC17_007351, partial [Serendipita sp. 399]
EKGSLKDVDNITRTSSSEKDAEKTPIRRIALGDLLVLLALLGLVGVSVATIALIFVYEKRQLQYFPTPLTNLQTVIGTATVPVATAVLRLLARRYVYVRLTTNGLRSRRVANLSNWSIAEFLGQIASLRFEPLGFLLFLAYLLATATGLVTVRFSAMMSPLISRDSSFSLLMNSGSLDPAGVIYPESLVLSTSATISSVASAISSSTDGLLSYINVTNAYAGSVYYPPIVFTGTYVVDATLNGLKVNVTSPKTLPPNGVNLTCAPEYQYKGKFYSLQNTTNLLSFIYIPETGIERLIQVDSTPVLLKGRFSMQRLDDPKYTYFKADGTSTPMQMDNNAWARLLMEVVCSSVLVHTTYSPDNMLQSLGEGLNQRDMYEHWGGFVPDERIWSSVMGTVVGAYSMSMFGNGIAAELPNVRTDIAVDWKVLTRGYGIYVLMVNTAVSIFVLVVVWRLLRASALDRDFLDSTRLLLNPLEDTHLFNATLDDTISKLDDPYLQIVSSRQILVKKSKDDVENSPQPPVTQ